MIAMFKKITFVSIIGFSISGCGGGNNDDVSSYQTLYDENSSGRIPYVLFTTSDGFKYTFAIAEGANAIKGTTTNLGESFVIKVPNHLQINKINITITTTTKNNTHSIIITDTLNGTNIINKTENISTGSKNSYQILITDNKLSNDSYHVHTNSLNTDLTGDPFTIEFMATKK